MRDWQAREVVLPEEFMEFERAISNAGVIDMVYASQGQPAQARRIRPLIIHCQGDVLYVNAYCYRAQAERTFRLDRIQSYRVIDTAGDLAES
jgi:proteasome accessory factor C